MSPHPARICRPGCGFFLFYKPNEQDEYCSRLAMARRCTKANPYLYFSLSQNTINRSVE